MNNSIVRGEKIIINDYYIKSQYKSTEEKNAIEHRMDVKNFNRIMELQLSDKIYALREIILNRIKTSAKNMKHFPYSQILESTTNNFTKLYSEPNKRKLHILEYLELLDAFEKSSEKEKNHYGSIIEIIIKMFNDRLEKLICEKSDDDKK